MNSGSPVRVCKICAEDFSKNGDSATSFRDSQIGFNLEKSGSFESPPLPSSNPRPLVKKDSKARLSEYNSRSSTTIKVPPPFSQGELTPEKPHTKPPPVPKLSTSTERGASFVINKESEPGVDVNSQPNQPTQMQVHRERVNTGGSPYLGEKPDAPKRPPRPERSSLTLSASQANAINQSLAENQNQNVNKPPPPSRPRLPTSSAPFPSEVFVLRKKVEEITHLLTEEINARRESEKNFKDELENLTSQIEQLKKAVLLVTIPSRPPPMPTSDDS